MVTGYRHMFHRILLLCLFLLTGCVSHEYKSLVRLDSHIPPYDFSVGDVVTVITTKEQSFEFKITEVSETSILGKNIEVKYDEIQAAKVKQVDGLKTFDNVGNSLLGIEIIIGVAFAIAFAA